MARVRRGGRVLRLLLGAATVALFALQMLYRTDLPAKAYTYASQVAIAMQMITTTLSTPNTTSKEYPIDNGGKLRDCILPPDLGPVLIKQQDLIEDEEAKLFLSIKWGGVYAPHNCTAKWKVAIIVPYRDRRDHLARFLKHMHPFLIKQQIHYGLFVIEQLGLREFNRGKLLNIGFVESQKLYPGVWQCFIFHDVDLLPLNSRNVYACPRRRWPRHMSAAVDKFGYGLPYDGLFGGVSAVTLEQFTKVNGFSNEYWGWGGEDNDMFKRLTFNNYTIARYDLSIARYVMLKHNQQALNPIRHALLSREMGAYRSDGLSNLEYYVMKISQNRLFTHILVDIG